MLLRHQTAFPAAAAAAAAVVAVVVSFEYFVAPNSPATRRLVETQQGQEEPGWSAAEPTRDGADGAAGVVVQRPHRYPTPGTDQLLVVTRP
jgi:hypothetical protein